MQAASGSNTSLPKLPAALIDAARPCRRTVGGRWFVDETYVKVAGVRCYVYGCKQLSC